ncbi:MAG: FixH family protein [Geminicoccaceae bacterium]
MSASRPAAAAAKGAWIPWLFVAFFAVVIAVNATMVWYALESWTGIATNDPYDQGLTYNRNLAAAEAQAALGWQSRLAARLTKGQAAEARFVLTDAQGGPIEGADVEASFERPTSEGVDFRLTLAPRDDGSYGASFALPVSGLWRVHITARRQGDLYVHDERVMLR